MTALSTRSVSGSTCEVGPPEMCFFTPQHLLQRRDPVRWQEDVLPRSLCAGPKVHGHAGIYLSCPSGSRNRISYQHRKLF